MERERKEEEKTEGMNRKRLDKGHEGRDEVVEKHWQRRGGINYKTERAAEARGKNMKAFSDEGLIYMEPDYSVIASIRPDGTRFSPEEGVKILQERLAQTDVKKTGMTIRFQLAILRFVPDAIEHLRVLATLSSVSWEGRHRGDEGETSDVGVRNWCQLLTLGVARDSSGSCVPVGTQGESPRRSSLRCGYGGDVATQCWL